MDIITQGLVGAIAAQSAAPRGQARPALLIGLLAGLPADADIVIRAADDPLLTLEFHRQFTHSLLFIPVGGLICGLLLWLLPRHRLTLPVTVGLATLAYGTSGLLDACTSYGTQLLWPFSDVRIAWSIISVFDPLFSLTLVVLLILGWRATSPRFARAGVLFALGYLALGLHQHQQAEQALRQLAAARGHAVQRLVVKPTMGNLLLWRGIYQSQGHFHIQAIRVSPFSAPRHRPGARLPVWGADDRPDVIPAGSVAHTDMLRFRRFSDGFVAPHPEKPHTLVDVRYALLPQAGTPLWGIVWDPRAPDRHVAFRNWRQVTSTTMDQFVAQLIGDDPALRPIPPAP